MKKIIILATLLVLICLMTGCATVNEAPWGEIIIPEISEQPIEPSVTPGTSTPEESLPAGNRPTGLVLNPDRIPTVEPYTSEVPDISTPDPTESTIETSTPDVSTPVVTIPDDPAPTSTPEPETKPIQEIDLTAGLRQALETFGKTTTDGINFVAYAPISRYDGGICIIHIASNASSGIKKVFFYYENQADYDAAKENTDPESCNDKYRLILSSVSETMPVTNPNNTSYVLLDGYGLW